MSITYVPSMLDDTPIVVPFTITFTPASGFPLASVTVPVIRLVPGCCRTDSFFFAALFSGFTMKIWRSLIS